MTRPPETPARSSGYSFIAMRSTSGVMHVTWSSHFADFRHAPPAGHTLCGRRTSAQWTEVGAEEWYTGPARCLVCEPRIGPYATVKL